MWLNSCWIRAVEAASTSPDETASHATAKTPDVAKGARWPAQVASHQNGGVSCETIAVSGYIRLATRAETSE